MLSALTTDGLRPSFKARLGGLTVEHLPPMLAELHAALSPEGPQHVADVFSRLSPSWTSDSRLPLFKLGDVTVTVLVLAGDDDILTLAHIGELQDGLPNVQVAVIPGRVARGPPWRSPTS